MFIYLCIFIFRIFFEDHIGNNCAIVCFNVSISSVNIIYMRISLFAYALYTNFLCACIIMFYQINSLTHMSCNAGSNVIQQRGQQAKSLPTR